MNGKNKTLKIFLWLTALLLIALIGLSYWLYNGPLNPLKIKTFSYLPFPAASVNGHFIPVSQLITRYSINKNLGLEPDQKTILNELVGEKETAILAGNKGVGPGSKQIDGDYNFRAKQADLEGKKDFDQLLKSYGITTQEYKSEVIEPALNTTNLQVWFYSQQNLNTSAYQKAQDLVQRIQKGDNMNSLATQYSDQASDRSTGGDLGYLAVSQLLPEIQETVGNMKKGDIKIVPSRYGIQILRLEDVQNNNLNLREIFINGSDFQTWLSNETKNYSVQQFLKN